MIILNSYLSYVSCISYIIIIIAHSFTLFQEDFYHRLISIFSFALFTETLSTILTVIHHIANTYGEELAQVSNLNLSLMFNFQYVAQFIHITAINFFILFLLIVAKGWPITRRDIPFKYAFAIFWLLCLFADLITFYWTTITVIAKNITSHSLLPSGFTPHDNNQNSSILSSNTTTDTSSITSNSNPSSSHVTTIATDISNASTTDSLSSSILRSLPDETEGFNSTPRRLSLALRVVIMLYFLLELRTTMILEQEKKKLKFYLNFGALTMVWFIHSLIVYIVSLRVEAAWQSNLIYGFTSLANILAFSATTRLLWPSNPRSKLFRKQKSSMPDDGTNEAEMDNFSTVNVDEDYEEEEYEGLEMRDLREHNNNNNLEEYDHNTITTTSLQDNRNENAQPRIMITTATTNSTTTTTNSG